MKKEKERGIEDLYNYLIKSKPNISKQEYNRSEKGLKKALFKYYKEGSISDKFFQKYYKKIRELEKGKIV